MKFAVQQENVAPHRKPYQNLASIIHLSLVPHYDHATHLKSSNIPNLFRRLSWCESGLHMEMVGGSEWASCLVLRSRHHSDKALSSGRYVGKHGDSLGWAGILFQVLRKG